jgi:SAM-dependent methyltransferase
VTEIERDVTTLRAYSHGIEDAQASALAALAVSHSIATKISLRWMGTGDNRFSVSVNSRSILDLFKKHLAFMGGALATATALSPSTSRIEVIEGSALALPFDDASFDGIVTSPPYVPASSGRETYLRSRGPSLIALDLVRESEIPERESRMVGSVLNRDGLGVELPAEITELVEWMRPQRARAPKAEATGAYFAQLDCALREMARVLKPGGRAAMVLASVHTLYDLLTRETVRVMDMPVLVERLLTCGEPIPLRLTRSIRMDLAKMDFAARPGARGGYSEAILFFEHR